MPTYDYRCTCGYRELLTHSIEHDPEVICTYCDKPLIRKPNNTTVTFSGSGWGKD